MSRLIDLTGQRFGRLVVMGRDFSKNYTAWQCLCDCGQVKAIASNSLRRGYTESCGCIVRTHGLSGTRVYHIWESMKARCQNPNAANYAKYGGRGIAVCDRWQSFENFHADMGEPPSEQHSLDRRDSAGDYTLDNCRWASLETQSQNRASAINLTFQNETHCVAEWSRRLGVGDSTIRERLRHGWSVENALSTYLLD